MTTEETKIVDCDLSIYVKKKLISLKIETIKQLLDNEINDLTKFRGLGTKSINELLIFTHKNGFYFK